MKATRWADAARRKGDGPTGAKAAWRGVLARFDSKESVRLLLEAGVLGRSLPVDPVMPITPRILVLVPHQDDEGIGCAGTLMIAAREGAQIRIVYYTDGRTGLGGMDPGAVSAARKQEARRAWARVPNTELIFLDRPNGETEPPPEAVSALAGLIGEFDPTAIFLPTFIEEPPEHRMLTDWLLAAAETAPLAGREIWGYQITTNLPGNALVDVSGVERRKYRLNRKWRSQNALYDYAELTRARDIANSYFMKGGRFLKRPAASAELFLRFPAEEYVSLARAFSRLPDGSAETGEPSPDRTEPDFFVIGLQKSGSYWLTAILDAHPEIRCFPSRPGHADGTGEAHLFDNLARLRSDYPSFRASMKRKLEGRWADIVASHDPPEPGAEEERLIKAIRDRFAEYCDEQRRLHRARFVGEKTTEYAHHLDLLDRLFPAATKICVLRDPRDRVVSFHHHQVRKRRRGADEPIDAEFVDAYLERVEADYDGLLAHPERCVVVTYEELHADPVPEVRSMLEAIGADASPETAAACLRAASFDVVSREQGSGDGPSHFRKGQVGTWREELPAELAERIQTRLAERTRRLEEVFGLDLRAYRTTSDARSAVS